LPRHPPAESRQPTPAPGVIIEAKQLAFDGVVLFQDLRLDLKPGEWTALLGDSGVGKSTLLRIAAGLDAGEGDYSANLSGGGTVQNHVALMAQRDALLPWLSVLENACLGDRLRGTGAKAHRERAASLLTDVGLGDYLEAKPATLSGGMRQRVALIRTLIEDRPIVLLDEPFAALDALNRHRMQDLSARMLAGKTVLHVTHDPLEALRLAHRIVMLEGRPVRLREEAVPDTPPPRPADHSDVSARHGVLLDQLLNPPA
jgi:putative hydroxymethylpyrimidine transport system ATP-binding protein